MTKATLTLHRKRRYDDGAILELKLWQVPAAVPGSGHLFGIDPVRWTVCRLTGYVLVMAPCMLAS